MTIINSQNTQSCETSKNATQITLVNQGTKIASVEITTEDGTINIQKQVAAGQTVNCTVHGNGPYTVTNKSNVNVNVTWT